MKHSRLAFLYLIGFCVLLIIGGCGGGTRGSGGITVGGRVIDLQGQPLADVLISILESGDTATTDSNGQFEIASELETTDGGISLLFEKDEVNASTRIDNIPSGTDTVRATFRVDRQNNRVEPEEIETEDRNDDRNSGRDDDDDRDDSRGPGSGSDDDSHDDDKSGPGSGSDDDSDDDSSDDSFDDSNDDDSSGSGSGSGSDDDNSGPGSGGSSGGSCNDEDAEGPISAISASSVTVSGITYALTGSTEYRNDDESPASSSDFSVGDFVKVKGDCVGSTLVADRLEFDDE